MPPDSHTETETDTERLIREAREVYRIANEPSHMGQRDLRSMLASIELQAKLLGIGGTGAGADVAAVKRELERMGLEVRPKRLRAVE